MAFNDNIIFPTKISYGSTKLLGGRNTRVIYTSSGKRYTQSRKSLSMNRFNVLYGIKTYEDLQSVADLYEAVGHELEGFLFKDHLDSNSGPYRNSVPTFSDQNIGTGDGSTTTFQLRKAYVKGSKTYYRRILKPKTATVTIGKAGVQQMSGWSVNLTTGIVTFDTAPTLGQAITAGFEYYVPVAFDNPELDLNMDHFQHGTLGDIMLVELLNA